MNHDERQLIADLFDRMRSVQGLDKDTDAEAFIHQSMRDNANSPYLLVQSVLAQEVALQQAAKRIEDLEAEVAGRAGVRSSAGFSGAVPAGQQAPWESQQPAANGSPWGAPVRSGSAASSSSRSSGVPSTNRSSSFGSAEPVGNARGAQQPQAPAARGGGFMSQALTTAAGVAGGMMLANSIGSLFGGGSTPANAATAQSATPASDTSNFDDPSANSLPLEDVSHADDESWGGSDDFGGGDFEI